MNTINFTPEAAKKFADAYNRAVKADAKSFYFDGNEFVRGYAYYVIQYLEMNKIISGKFNQNKTYSYGN